MTCLWRVLFLLVQLQLVIGYSSFRDKIPNGNQVPHPCKPNYIWKGVGHKNALGGGERNPFGLDFKANGLKWDKTICEKDSDGDEKSNGEELGDPLCEWTVGSIPKFDKQYQLSHPGVCEPTDSPNCTAKNQWEFCTETEFKCPWLNDSDVLNITFRFDDGLVPNKETSYFCQTFELPNDRDYHVVATEPVIDNRQVMHHMILHGCQHGLARKNFTTPSECGMDAGGCRESLAGWTVGSVGDCQPADVGIRFGKNSIRYATLEFHWNNPELRSDYRDHSGIRLYYTPVLRKYDAQTLAIGQTYLAIPPGKSSHLEKSTCRSTCTKTLNGTLNIYSASLHMHYLGVSGSIEHWRGGQKIGYIANDVVYSYDSPVDHYFDPPLTFLPGDEMKMTCGFKSTSRSEITYYGDGTSSEMCFGFVTFYPRQEVLPLCMDFADIDLCEAGKEENGGIYGLPGKIDNCNLVNFLTSESTPMYIKLVSNCDLTGDVCWPDCKEYVKNEVYTHACMTGKPYRFLDFIGSRDEYFSKMTAAINSCAEEIKKETKDNGGHRCGGNAFLMSGVILMFMKLLL